LSLARDAYSNQQSKIGNRNGLFGDTQYDNTSMFGDTSDFSEANQRKVLEPFQAKIDAAQRELDNLIKARDGYIKQAEGQKSIESKSVGEESPKSKDKLQEEPKGEKLKRKDAVAKDTPEQPDVEAGAVTSNLSNSKDINKTLNTKELEEKSNIEPQKQLEEQKQQDDSQQIENAAIKVVAEKSYKSPIHQRK